VAQKLQNTDWDTKTVFWASLEAFKMDFPAHNHKNITSGS